MTISIEQKTGPVPAVGVDSQGWALQLNLDGVLTDTIVAGENGSELRVGILTDDPQTAFDINGVLRVRGKSIRILESDEGYDYTIAAGTINDDYTLSLPSLLTGNDEFALLDHEQTLTNKTLTNPRIDNTIYDGDGEIVMSLTADASAANWITVASKATGNAPWVGASGTDTNIDLSIYPKGTGTILPKGRMVPLITTVTDGAGFVCDLSLGNEFRITAAADRTAGTTTNYKDGQWWVLEFTASGGSRTLTLPTSTTGDFAFNEDITALSATTSGKTDILLFEYRSATGRNEIRAYIKGN